MTRKVSGTDRRRDAVAFGVLLAGALLYGYSWLHLRGMAEHPIVRESGRTAVQRATIYYNISRGGIALIAVGIIAVGWSYWRHARGSDRPQP